ncbi:MAG: transglutaminase-like cysteine peptidase [Hyphomicrobium sp.]|nr:transglutaminase-like cysteine peptidase [Hyphomicrobium sp.]
MSAPYTPRLSTANLGRVNSEVNKVPYRSDPHRKWIAPRDFWSVGGDCEDYAMAKAAELQAAGRQGLWLAVLTNGPAGEAHAVLVAEDQGGMVTLDNREAKLVPWSITAARYEPAYIVSVGTGQVFRTRHRARIRSGIAPPNY